MLSKRYAQQKPASPGADAGVGAGHERRTHPRSVVAVDAACDLPHDFISANKVVVVPIRVLGASRDLLDSRMDDETARFVQGLSDKDDETYSVRALGSRETQQYLLAKIESNRDNVFQLTSSAVSTPVFSTCSHAARSLMELHKRARTHTGYQTKFRMWVMDSRTMFAGEGVLAYAAIEHIRNEPHPARVVDHLQSVRRAIHTVVVPTNPRDAQRDIDDLEDTPGLTRWLHRLRINRKRHATNLLLTRSGRTHTLATRSTRKDALDTAMRIAHKAYDQDLIVPLINVSYAGDLHDIEKRNDFQYLCRRAELNKTRVLLSPMSVVGTSNLGAGSLSLGFAPRKPITS